MLNPKPYSSQPNSQIPDISAKDSPLNDQKFYLKKQQEPPIKDLATSTHILPLENKTPPFEKGTLEGSIKMYDLPALKQENEGNKERIELKPIKLSFQKGNKIGRGPHGCVYESLNLTTGEILAVKTIRPKDIDMENLVFFQKNLLNLRHENLIPYRDFGFYNDDCFKGIFLKK